MAGWFERLQEAAHAGATEAAANTTQTYVEVTVVMLASLLTCMLVLKALPYITSSIAFFARFCACAVVLKVCIHFIEHSALVRTLGPAVATLKYMF